jgi:hypothetical protein
MWNGNGRKFIMGSDYGRAIAEQAGFQTYFSRQELLWLRRAQEQSDQAAADDGEQYRVVTHAVWNLGYPEGHDRDKALEYRLAGLAFFVAEYVRRFPDQFVNYIYDRHDYLRRNNEGFQVSQDVIREVIRDCFNFYDFERYGRFFYHDGSPQRYWVEDEPHLHAIHSRGIYFEMYELRAKCMGRFRQFEALVGDRDRSSAEVSAARELSQCAWNNYDVFNFHDALQQIERAVGVLERAPRLA